MKKTLLSLFLLATSLCTFSSCKKDDSGSGAAAGGSGAHPRSAVPDELVGYWLAGSTSVTNFWNYDGSYAGNGFELAVGYMLYKDGRAKEYFYYTKTSTYCYAQVLGYKEGTVVIDKDKKTFEFFAASGNYRSYDGCGSSQTPGWGQTKQYTSDELYPSKKVTLDGWSLEQENGRQVLKVPLGGGEFQVYEKSAEPQQ